MSTVVNITTRDVTIPISSTPIPLVLVGIGIGIITLVLMLIPTLLSIPVHQYRVRIVTSLITIAVYLLQQCNKMVHLGSTLSECKLKLLANDLCQNDCFIKMKNKFFGSLQLA